MYKRIVALVAFVTLLVAGAPSYAATPDLGTANLSWSPGPDTPQIAIAIDKGLWKQRGLAFKTSATQTGREALEQLIGGQADYALMAELPPVIGAMQHQNFKVIAALSRYVASRVIGNGSVDLSNLKNIGGKKIGTTQGTNVNFQEFAVMQSAGIISPPVVSVAPSDLVPALARGDVDVAFMFPQFYGQAKRVLGDKYREKLTPEYQPTFVLVASSNEIAQHPDRVKAMIAGLVEADGMLAKDLPGASVIVSTAMNGLIKPPDLMALWADYRFGIRLDRSLVALFDEEAHWVHNSGFVKGPDPTMTLFLSYVDPSFLLAAAPKNVQLK
jgi:NitT/TauT family transport system substrate-binding protein